MNDYPICPHCPWDHPGDTHTPECDVGKIVAAEVSFLKAQLSESRTEVEKLRATAMELRAALDILTKEAASGTTSAYAKEKSRDAVERSAYLMANTKETGQVSDEAKSDEALVTDLMLKMLNGTQTQRDWAQTHLFDRLAALRSRVEQLEAQLSKAVEQRESLEETRKHLLYTRELITTQRDSARAMGRRLRDVLLSVQEAHESSRKAVSKGSAQYDALFLWALYGGDVVAALDETKGLEEP